jgi:Immunity protein Imm6
MNLTEQYNSLLTNADLLLNTYHDNVRDYECFNEGQRVIGICKEWITNKEITADDIYETINSEDGYDIVEFSEMGGITEEETYMWVLLTDIVCALCSLAYQMENQKYVPQVIECIKEKEIEDFVMFLNKNPKSHDDIKKCVVYFNENVCY